MHIAILMTNTDESEFAQAWPKDGEKFSAMLRKVRPDWAFTVYSVKDGVFPETLDGIDGVMITGSPHSVNSGEAWVTELLEMIRKIYASGIPMFGACFGHQAIAMALGGDVGKNPNGWVHRLVDVRYADGAEYALYASHSEQVALMPEGAEAIAEGPSCGVAGFILGKTIETTQYHPEMEREFFAALTEEVADELGTDVSEEARSSLERASSMQAFAERIALFLERKSA